MESNYIQITGARENNLKNLSLQIPKNKITVITGPSGSGKSSLAFDTIHAESQWRFLENLSLSSKLFVKKLPRPEVESITGLSPSLALKQGLINTANRDVGAFSDISNLLAVIFARQAKIICPDCEKEIKSYTAQEIVNLYSLEEVKLEVLAPYRFESVEVLDELREKGIVRLKIDSVDYRLDEDEDIPLSSNISNPSDSYIVLDRVKSGNSSRLFDSIEYAYRLTNGKVSILERKGEGKELHDYQQKLVCCGNELSEITPKLFLQEDALQENVSQENISFIKIDSLNFSELKKLDLEALKKAVDGFKLDKSYQAIKKQVLNKLTSLIDLDLGSLSLSRKLKTLSSGELQRLRLSGLHSLNLEGVLYVLDEPSAYLGKDEIPNVCNLINGIREKNNTLIIVDHHPEIINMADFLIEIGPKSGSQGGEIISSGKRTKKFKHRVIKRTKNKISDFISINGIEVPSSGFTVIKGKSGSGKTRLLADLRAQLEEELPKSKKVYDLEVFNTNKSHRSNPATILDVYAHIRKLYSATTDAKVRGFKPSRFSFNVKGGRCEDCIGTGVNKVEIDLLSNIFVKCETCEGRRYNNDTLGIKYKNLNINDVLNLSLVEAANFFKNIPKVYKKLSVATELGLGYLKLGQNSTCLSGGELQRLKLCDSLIENFNSYYLLDEPTIGLHSSDVENLVSVFDRLISKNNVVVCASQNEELVGCADYVLELS